MTSRNIALLIARRVATAALLLVLISFLVFSLLYITPGSEEQILLGENPATPETIAALRKEYHLDEPFIVQYRIWALAAARLDFGRSSETLEPVTQVIQRTLPVTGFLAAYAFILTMVLGIGGGVLAALRPRSIWDRCVVSMSLIGVSTPAFASGVLLLVLFSIHWSLLPSFGPGDGFTDRLAHLTLPALGLTFSVTALVIKVTRTAMIEAMRQDYVAFARARGLSPLRIVFVYGLRNALVPVVTSSGIVLAHLFAGAVLIEQTFSLPGLGQLLVHAVRAKDLPVLQAVALVFAAAVITINLVTDLIYLVIDPRIRFGRVAA